MKAEIIAGWTEPEETIGILNIIRARGTERISVEVDQDWVKRHDSLSLDPDLGLFRGPQYPPYEKKLFGFLSDSSPDRWGRKLIERQERITAERENRPARTMNDSDYLLGVSDMLRYGGIRFRDYDTGRYLSYSEPKIPPISDIRLLEDAARGYETSDDDEKAVRLLLEPGSSLGGARPKANVRDVDGSLWIAKFPSKNDDCNIGAWEMVEHDLASLCGIVVPDAKLMNLSERGSTFLSERFDRAGEKRIHMMSAMTALGMTDGKTDGVSYTDIADVIEQISIQPGKDLIQLWKRMTFNILTSNCDDHLRNHGFVLRGEGWALSPAYDLNPVPFKDHLSLNVAERDNRCIPEHAVSVSEYFRISKQDAKDIINEMESTISGNWREKANRYHIREREVRYMEPAFKNTMRQ